MHQRHVTLLFSILLLSCTAFAQEPDSSGNKAKPLLPTKDTYWLVYDGLYDMNGSAQNLLSISHLFGRGLDEITCKLDTATGYYQCGGKDAVVGRIFLDGFNFIFTNWLSIVQHEGMGHGFRIREFDVPIRGYNLAPTMFGGKAQVYFDKDDLPYYGKVLEDVAGSEGNTVFAREAFRQSLGNEHFYHYYMYAFALKLDMPLYILGSPKVDSNGWNTYLGGGWDVVEYIKDLDPKSTKDQHALYSAAQRGARWSLLDPSLLLSLFQYARDFIIKGRVQVRDPMIRINGVSFLPYTDFHLSPFGCENYAGTYLKLNRTLFETYYRWSNGNVDGHGYGLGVNMINLIHLKSFKFDAGVDLWKQDFNLLHYDQDTEKYHENLISGKVYARAYYQPNPKLSLYGQVSYKGDGYLIGNPVERGANGKIGIGFYF